MKTTQEISAYLIVLIVLSLLFSSCKKEDEPAVEQSPKSYSEIQIKHIAALESSMKTTEIVVSNETGLVFNPGDVIVFKTNEGRFGKLEIISIEQNLNYRLTAKITVFESNGSIFLSTNSVTVRGTYPCDLDIVAELSVENTSMDFHWNRLTNTNTVITPKNGAKFVKYTFSK
jgi:hypothetical protein